MSRLRLGLLSTARINEAILTGAGGSDRVDVVAVGSRDRARAEAYAHAHGLEHAHASYEALLADPDVDAVYISLPNSMHVEWSVRALEAGKHVLCEKPMSPDPGQVERAFDAAARAAKVLMEAFMWRHHPQTKKLVELVERGSIGNLRLVVASFSFTLDNVGDPRFLPELEGGSLMDVGTYCVSGSRLLAGEPELALGRQVLGPTGVDLRFAGVLSFPGDVLAHFDCGFDLPMRRGLAAVGSEGTASLADPWGGGTAVELRRGEEVERIAVEDADPYRLQLENFAAAVRGDEEPLLGRADAVGQARTVEALYRSAETGTAVRL